MIVSTTITTLKTVIISTAFLCHSLMNLNDNMNKVCLYNELDNRSIECWTERDIVNYLVTEKVCMNRWLSGRYEGGCVKLFIKIGSGNYHILCGPNKPIIKRVRD